MAPPSPPPTTPEALHEPHPRAPRLPAASSPGRRDAIATGLVLIAGGVGLGAHRAGAIDGIALLEGWWPALLIVAGAWHALVTGGRAVGTAIAVLGVALLAALRADVDVSPGALVGPGLLAVIGVGALRAGHQLRAATFTHDATRPRAVAVFGDARVHVGEDAPDLPHPVRPVVSVFGDVSVDVPAGWRIEDHVTNIFGSVKVPREQPHYPEAPALTLHGLALFGDVRARYVDPSEVP